MMTPAREMPEVVKWFKVYCGFMCLLYVGVAAASLIFFLVPPAELDMPAAGARFMGVIFLVIGFTLFVLFLLPFLVGRVRWMWGYGIALIAIGMTSACCVLACVPLLIFWVRPGVREYYALQ